MANRRRFFTVFYFKINRVITGIAAVVGNDECNTMLSNRYIFIKKIKSLHPELTPNDLRLCAYLRLNLPSKEIAPLLNISHRSVEVKRYRLRKKMNLDHKENLTEYILNL